MDSKVEELVGLTGVSEEQARSFLEAANGDVNVAAGYIIDGNETGHSAPVPVPVPTQAVSLPKPSIATQKPESRAGITGFRDLAKDNEDKKPDKDMSWFTGGASSGIQVQAPPQLSSNDLVKNVFEQAKRHGAISKSDEKPEEKEKFGGSGFVLGNNEQKSHIVPSMPKPQGPRRVVLTFYKDCFTVDDGPPRKNNDPANQPFIDDVNAGVVPRELEGHGDIKVELIDVKHEEYKPKPKQTIAFSGSGQTLGGQVLSSTKAVAKKIAVDEGLPVTTLQIRLDDGTRLILKLNHVHTVGDVRAHIEAERPSGKAFELRTTFPAKILADDAASIKDAGLLNAAIVQRF